MKFIRRAITLLILVLLSWFSADAQQEEALDTYYFYSSACPHCANVAPFIKELSKVIHLQGFIYGKGDAEPMPFEVRKADKGFLRRYDVHTFPTLAIMKNGAVKQMLIGEQDIKDARMILSAFRKGAWSVSEAIEKKPKKTYTVIGWIANRGEYFKNARFVLTDRKRTISVKPWLPLEVVKSPFKKARPRLMSDVIDKPAYLEGTLTKINDDFQFTVRKEIIIE